MKLYTYTKNGKVHAVASFRKTDARIYCDFKVEGKPPVTAYAGGGGYDRHGAAFDSCLKKLNLLEEDLGEKQEFSM